MVEILLILVTVCSPFAEAGDPAMPKVKRPRQETSAITADFSDTGPEIVKKMPELQDTMATEDRQLKGNHLDTFQVQDVDILDS